MARRVLNVILIAIILFVTGCSAFSIRKEFRKEKYPKYYKWKKNKCLYKIKNISLYCSYLKKPSNVHTDKKDLIIVVNNNVSSVFLHPVEEKVVIDSFFIQLKHNNVSYNKNDSLKVVDKITYITNYNSSTTINF
jgi:hypothetical protein